MAKLPRVLAELGVRVLQAEWLRTKAGLAAYFDKRTYATKDAVRLGRLHTFQPGWMEANVAFMRSGGYSVSSRIKDVSVDTLVLWGRNDEILDAKFAEQFTRELPTSRLVYVERCGHTPHLESAPFVAEQIKDFLGLDHSPAEALLVANHDGPVIDAMA
uniref:AB hydrolase-1 domain-containing protein n=1 Tax=Chlamydomonas euryale TaxID=1486919 RepID=A0A7R9VBF3_9CHLO